MRQIFSMDLTRKNDVLLLPKSVGCVLAGACLVETNGDSATKKKAISQLCHIAKRNFPSMRLWLLAGHESWQPDNRIVRRRRLWSSLAMDSLLIGEKANEYVVESGNGIKFFGFIECLNYNIQELVEIIEHEASCTLIASSGEDVASMLDTVARLGWDRQSIHHPPVELLKLGCKSEIMIFETIGRFDDQEVGGVLIARPETISSIFSILPA